jgi:hypothetical protein
VPARPAERASGPGPVTNFDRVLVERGSRGLCATFGDLDLAGGRLSILIEQPRLPGWILDRRSSWSARLT